MEGEVTLYLSIYGKYRKALLIPISECTTKSLYPLKWLRFLGYALYGEEGDLHLSARRGGQLISDYTSNIEARSYYFISPDPPRLVDLMGMDDRTSIFSAVTTRRRGFRTSVVERDGTCVLSNTEAKDCEAAHIIPHSKTYDYISNFVRIRARPDDNLQLEGINDPRNGLLLHKLVHHHLGRGHLAFLKTPNFALDVDDVQQGPPELPASRLTLQFIGIIRDPVFLNFNSFNNNSDARQPDDLGAWPPAVIFDFFYGCAALNAWGRTPFKEFIKDLNFVDYYGSAEVTPGELADESGEEGGISQQVKDHRARYKQREKTRKGEQKDDQEEYEFEEVMDLVMGLWMRHEPKCQPEPDISHVPKVDHSQREKVEAWLESS